MATKHARIDLDPEVTSWPWRGRVYRLASQADGSLVVTNDRGQVATVRIGSQRNSWGPSLDVEPTRGYAAATSILTALVGRGLARYVFPDGDH